MRVQTVRTKQPFLPETRNIGNLCICAACGCTARADAYSRRRPSASIETACLPREWKLIRVKSKQLFLCATCALHAVAKNADRFYLAYDAVWNPTAHAWSLVPTKQTKTRVKMKA